MAVADGMGGHRAGEVASAMAIQKLVSRLSQGGRRISISPIGNSDGWLGEEVRHVNMDVHRAASDPELHGMGTTLTAALLAGDNLYMAHVGDSRAYRLRGGEIQQLTRDHSWVTEQVEAGLLTPNEAREHPRRNILTRALGTTPELEVDSAVITVLAGDYFLLCSDGLHSLVTADEIARIMAAHEPRQACEALVERANALGGNDNITALVLRIDTMPLDGERKRPRTRHQPAGNSPFMTPVRALARLSRGDQQERPAKRTRGRGGCIKLVQSR